MKEGLEGLDTDTPKLAEEIKIAVIGGSGLSQLRNFTGKKCVMDTPYGNHSNLNIGQYKTHPIAFMARHGNPHQIPPHAINYRANIYALHLLGIKKIIAVHAVGGIKTEWPVGSLCFPDQLIDYTWGREHTFYSGQNDSDLEHIDFSYPFDKKLRITMAEVAESLNYSFFETGVYGCTQGPRLETAAEIKRLERDGCDLVGMTAMPEVALAREMGISYASMSLIVNPAAGLSKTPITMQEIQRVMAKGGNDIQAMIEGVLLRL